MIRKVKFKNGRIHQMLGESGDFAEISDFVEKWNDGSDSICVHTSGSTGIPKPIFILKEEMRASARLTGSFFGINRPIVAWHALPMSFIAGKMMVVRALEFDWDLIWSDASANPEIPDVSPEFAAFTPMQFFNLLQNGLEPNFSRITILGGGEVSEELGERLKGASQGIFSTYGMTETITHVACRPISGKVSEEYQALAGVSFSQDERGCLVVVADHLSSSPFITNDQVDLLSPTTFVFKGRADRVINSGGLKIHPEAIERKLQSEFGIELFVTSKADDELGQRVVLVIQQKNEDLQSKIQEFLNVELDRKIRPKEIVILENFKYTHTGKLVKRIIE